MARVILYISNDVYDKVNAIVEQRRWGGQETKRYKCFREQLQCFLNWGFVYMRLRWSAKSLCLIRQSLINFSWMCCKNTVNSSENFGYWVSKSPCLRGIQSLNMPIWLKIFVRRCHLRWNDFFQKMMRNKNEFWFTSNNRILIYVQFDDN